MSTPVVAIVGRPNVGKSSLFNRLIKSRRSIVADQPGVTRDRIYARATLASGAVDIPVILVDTGGFDPTNRDPIMQRVLEQTQLAIDEADVVIFLVDGHAGPLPEDHEIARRLRKGGKSAVIGVNKLDGPSHDALFPEFFSLGFEKILAVSAAHGRNVGDLEEAVVELLDRAGLAERQTEGPVASEVTSDDAPVRVAVIGRPNVGKSSLVNRLLGEDRHLVSAVAGTTIDSIDSLVRWRDTDFLFVDTAGIRRKRSIAHRVERFSVFAALKGLERSDIALLLIDATQAIANQDAKVSAHAGEQGKAVVLVISKWDQRGRESRKEFQEKLRHELAHLSYAPLVFTSAFTGEGVDQLLPTLARVHKEYGRRITTAKLNRFAKEVMEHHPPSSRKGRAGKIYYVSQVDVRPPQFMVSVNDPGLIHFSYRRYLVNAIRKAFGFVGVPLLVHYRAHRTTDEAQKRVERGKFRAQQDPRKRATAARRLKKAGKSGAGSSKAFPRRGPKSR
ncbi:MAG: ribosome biogenesis GTPase Der [Myxococcota bacterium]